MHHKMAGSYQYVDANVKLSLGERVNYALGDFGYNFIYYWVSSYMMIYFTDVIGVAAGAVSLVTLVMRLFDAFNDPLIGSLADRTRSRWGRYRPWILVGGIALAASVAILFAANPDWSMTTKLVFMWGVYCLVTVCSTCCNMPFGAMNGVITSNAGERVKLAGMRMVFANAGLQGCGIIAIPLITMVGGMNADGTLSAGGYQKAVLITCIIGAPFLVWCACKTKERLQPPPEQEHIPLSKQFSCLKNKYVVICVITSVLGGVVMYGKMSMLTYYFGYVCGDDGLMTTYSTINLVGSVLGAGLGASFFYKLLKNKGKVGMLINAVSLVGCSVMYFFLAPHPVWLVMNVFVAFFSGVNGGIVYSMTPDAIDVAELQTGVRCDGFLASFVSLALKVGGAIGPALGGAALQVFGFIPNVAQSESVLNMLNFSVTIVPAACAAVSLVCFFFYDLDDEKHMEDRFLIGLAQLADEAHKYGALISYELSHSGRCDLPSLRERAQADGMTEERPIPKKEAMIDEMTREDMEWFIRRQVDSCLRAKKAGFDIIFVHAGHNAGLGSCLSPLTNHRTDEYGGSRENRIRFPLEVIKAVRNAVGDMPIEVRASARDMVDGGLEVEDTIAFFQAIEPYIDLAHVSNGNMFFEAGRIYTSPMYTMEHKQNVPYSQQVKRALQIPVTVVGNIYALQDAEEILASGQADVVGFCRSVLADPQLFRKAAEGREEDVRPCLRCMDGCGLIFHGLPARCAVNPTLGRESDCRLLRPSQQKKKVVVVGGGPAGMQAAQTLTALGHEVVLFEKSDHLGGLLCDASQVSFKQLMRDYLAWNVRTTLGCGAKIYLGTEATAQRIASERPDEVIVATGSTYLRPPIPGIDGPNVVMLRDAESGAVALGDQIIICGGGLSGVEAAVDLGRQGKKVTVIDMIPVEDFCKGLFFFAYEALFKEVRRAGVTLLGERKILRFDQNGLETEHKGSVERLEADHMILALGLRSNRTLADQLLTENPFHTAVVGDAAKVANLRHANSTAYYAAIHAAESGAY